MLADVAGPADIAVGGVGEVAQLEHQQHVLAGEDIDYRLEGGAYIPGYPLLPDTEEDEQSVGYTDGGGAGVYVSHPGLYGLVAAEQVGGYIEVGHEVAEHDRPDDDAGDYSDLRPAGELTHAGYLLLSSSCQSIVITISSTIFLYDILSLYPSILNVNVISTVFPGIKISSRPA